MGRLPAFKASEAGAGANSSRPNLTVVRRASAAPRRIARSTTGHSAALDSWPTATALAAIAIAHALHGAPPATWKPEEAGCIGVVAPCLFQRITRSRFYGIIDSIVPLAYCRLSWAAQTPWIYALIKSTVALGLDRNIAHTAKIKSRKAFGTLSYTKISVQSRCAQRSKNRTLHPLSNVEPSA